MLEDIFLLDTPKKTSLQDRSTSLRIALKDYERSFQETHGRKPKQADIRLDAEIAAKYKQYQRVQHVLSGKLAFDKLDEVKPTKRSTSDISRRHDSRHDKGVGSSPWKNHQTEHLTPRKAHKALKSASDTSIPESPQQALLDAIGPTPHRDGKLLGLFDLLQRSGSDVTPSTARKRKIEALYDDTPERRSPLKAMQTPSGRSKIQRQAMDGDILDFLAGTPVKNDCTRVGNMTKHSRTPQSESAKFHLSQFFATPSTQRFLFPKKELSSNDDLLATSTSAQNCVLGCTPQKQIDTTGFDVTPAYLKRSTSFKDRLLSASGSQTTSTVAKSKRSSAAGGPPTLRHFRSSTSNVLLLSDIQRPTEQSRTQLAPSYDCDEYDDELAAMRDLETDTPQYPNANNTEGSEVMIEDSQIHDDSDGPMSPTQRLLAAGGLVKQVHKPYKKKGQKRTTKRTNIRPLAQSQKFSEPKFVAADDPNEAVEETQFVSDDEFDVDDHDDLEYGGKEVEKANVERTYDGGMKLLEGKENGKKPVKKIKKQVGMINPNAQSHTNFRSLKIKNKAAKAPGAGRAKFGRGRK